MLIDKELYNKVFYSLLDDIEKIKHIYGFKVEKIQLSPNIHYILTINDLYTPPMGRSELFGIPVEVVSSLHPDEVRVVLFNKTYKVTDEYEYNITDVNYRYITLKLEI